MIEPLERRGAIGLGDLRLERGLDQHQAAHAIRVSDRLRGRDQPADRVADQHHRLAPECGKCQIQRVRGALERERLRHRAGTMTRQVDQRHAMVARQPARGGEPVRRAASEPVHQHDGGTTPERRVERAGGVANLAWSDQQSERERHEDREQQRVP